MIFMEFLDSFIFFYYIVIMNFEHIAIVLRILNSRSKYPPILSIGGHMKYRLLNFVKKIGNG